MSPGLELVPVFGPVANVAVGGDFRFDATDSTAGGLDGGELGFVMAAGLDGIGDCATTTMLVTFDARNMMGLLSLVSSGSVSFDKGCKCV